MVNPRNSERITTWMQLYSLGRDRPRRKFSRREFYNSIVFLQSNETPAAIKIEEEDTRYTFCRVVVPLTSIATLELSKMPVKNRFCSSRETLESGPCFRSFARGKSRGKDDYLEQFSSSFSLSFSWDGCSFFVAIFLSNLPRGLFAGTIVPVRYSISLA